jgi:hypothetical protein
MKNNQLSRIEDAMDILCSVLSELNQRIVPPMEILSPLIGTLLTGDELDEIEEFYDDRRA